MYSSTKFIKRPWRPDLFHSWWSRIPNDIFNHFNVLRAYKKCPTVLFPLGPKPKQTSWGKNDPVLQTRRPIFRERSSKPSHKKSHKTGNLGPITTKKLEIAYDLNVTLRWRLGDDKHRTKQDATLYRGCQMCVQRSLTSDWGWFTIKRRENQERVQKTVRWPGGPRISLLRWTLAKFRVVNNSGEGPTTLTAFFRLLGAVILPGYFIKGRPRRSCK